MEFLDSGLNSKILMVTGKGGVGKSSIAAMLARQSAQSGDRTLLVELGDRSFYAGYFGLPSVVHEPTPVEKNLDVALWGREECLKDYVLHYLKVERVYKLFFQNKVMEAFFNAAPTVSEISITGKLTSALRNVGPPFLYDRIVVDAYATGHFLALLRAPRGLREAVPVGPVRDQTEGILRILSDPKLTSYVIVSLAETLPTVESIELFSQVIEEVGIKPIVFCNRLWSPPLKKEEMETLDQELPTTGGAREFHSYLKFVLQRQVRNLEMLSKLPTSIWGVPLVFSATQSKDLLANMWSGIQKVGGSNWMAS